MLNCNVDQETYEVYCKMPSIFDGKEMEREKKSVQYLPTYYTIL